MLYVKSLGAPDAAGMIDRIEIRPMRPSRPRALAPSAVVRAPALALTEASEPFEERPRTTPPPRQGPWSAARSDPAR